MSSACVLSMAKNWALWGRHLLETEKLVLLMRSLNEQAMGWMKTAKQNGGRKAFSSRGRFLSQNKEPRSSQSLWFIITLGIPHSCPTFCIRIFKTDFVLHKLSSGSSSSSRSSASCWGDLQLYNSYRSLLPTNIEHLSVAEHETGRNLINLRQIWNL